MLCPQMLCPSTSALGRGGSGVELQQWSHSNLLNITHKNSMPKSAPCAKCHVRFKSRTNPAPAVHVLLASLHETSQPACAALRCSPTPSRSYCCSE